MPKPMPEEIKTAAIELRAAGSTYEQITKKLEAKFGRHVSLAWVSSVLKKPGTTRPGPRKAAGRVKKRKTRRGKDPDADKYSDSDEVDKIMRDMHELIRLSKESYRGILLSIRRDLIKSRHEIRQLSLLDDDDE